MCKWCGAKITQGAQVGRPFPGQCLRRGKDSRGMHKPHVWVINRKF